jgi:hypothetical protein
MWIYMVCCHVLSQANDSRAPDLIQDAYDLIQQQASNITDSDLNYSFLNNVKANQEIQFLLAQGGDG